MRARLKDAGWLALTLLAIAMTVIATAGRSDATAESTATLQSWYRELAPSLPATGRVGFIQTAADDTNASREYFAAQYVLAPRVLVGDLGAVTFVITGTSAGPSVDERAARDGFEHVRSAAGGIKLYQRVRAR